MIRTISRGAPEPGLLGFNPILSTFRTASGREASHSRRLPKQVFSIEGVSREGRTRSSLTELPGDAEGAVLPVKNPDNEEISDATRAFVEMRGIPLVDQNNEV